MQKKCLFFTVFPLIICLSACAAILPAPPQTPVPTNTDTPAPTPTIVWFPVPTATDTVVPTTAVISPTSDLRPGIGAIILKDDFSDTSQWQTPRLTSSSVAYGNNELSVVVSQAGGYTMSLRPKPILDDFYLEITASPSLCRGADAYGVILHATEETYDRFAINCNGMLRFERVSSGQAQALQDWTPSSQVRPGAPQTMRLGLWVDGSTVRCFVNGVFQFEVKETVYTSGMLGVFARSAGTTSVSVNFSDLVVSSVTAH
jgi:hypothetical protein